MDYIKNIYANEKNQLYVRTQVETHLREKFNINIENIPNINTQVQEYLSLIHISEPKRRYAI